MTDMEKYKAQLEELAKLSAPSLYGQYPPASSEKCLTLAELEKLYIIQTYTFCKHNKNTAAKILGIGRATLYRKLRKYGVL